MNHLIQVARRTGKHAVGYKAQLVLHRMSAQLPAAFDGVELCAVITRHKKRVVTKGATYAADKKEVVWGDILPITCTLYLAKTGLFQAKVFQVQVFDTRTDQQIAVFEFNLAELVQSNRDASKESIMVPALKCQDHRASLSLTVIATKVTGARSIGGRDLEGSNADEVSFDGSRSDLSAITLESRGSRASVTSASAASRYGKTVTSPLAGGDKADGGVRHAHPVGDGDPGVELYALKTKHQELLRTVQDLEEQLRQSEGENVKLEKKVDERDLRIDRLQEEKEELELRITELEQQLQQHRQGANNGRNSSSSSNGGADGDDDDDGVMSVDFVKYMTLREERDALVSELEQLKATLASRPEQVGTIPTTTASTLPPPIGTPHIVEAEDDEDDEDDDAEHREEKRSEAAVSSVNEYMDAHESQLLAEINDLKHTVGAMESDRARQQSEMSALREANEQLVSQLRAMEGTLGELESANTAHRQIIEEQQEQLRRLRDADEDQTERRNTAVSEAQNEKERLVEQLSHLDTVVTKLRSEKDELANRLEHAESDRHRAEEDVTSAKQLISELEGEKSGLSARLEAADEAQERATHEIATAQSTIDDLRAQIQELSERLRVTQAELDTLRNEDLATSAAAAAAAIAKNQQLQERWDDLKLQNEQLQSRVEELEDRIAETESGGQEREAELQKQMQELQHETAQLREELEELRASKQQAEEELLERTAELKQALDGQQRLSIDHEHTVGELETQRQEAQTRLEEQAKEKEALEQELRKRVTDLEQENEYFQGELIDSKMRVAELTAKNEELSSQCHRMEKTVADLKTTAAAATAAATAAPADKNAKKK